MKPDYNIRTDAALRTAEFIRAAEAVIFARAYLSIVRHRVRPLQEQTMKRTNLVADLGDGRLITRIRDGERSTDGHARRTLNDDYKKKIIDAGLLGLTFSEAQQGHCPEIVAEQTVALAESKVLEMAEQAMALKLETLTPADRTRLIDRIVRIAVTRGESTTQRRLLDLMRPTGRLELN